MTRVPKPSGLAALVAIVFAGACGTVALSAASAAEPSGTVNIAASPEPAVGQPVSITVSGTSSQDGELAVSMLDSSSSPPGASCPAVQRTDEVNLADIAPPTPVSAGSYSQSYSVTPNDAGSYVLCGYLYEPSSMEGAVYAAGSGGFTAEWRLIHAAPPPVSTTGSTTSTPAPASPEPEPRLPHLTLLTAKARDHPGHTAAKPGHTSIVIRLGGASDVSDEPVFNVSFTLRRNGRLQAEQPTWSSGSSGEVRVPWNCRRPDGVYSFSITATDSYGKRLTRIGKFHAGSAARCRALKVADARRRREASVRSHEGQKESPGFGPDQEEREQQETMADQDNLCKSGLGGSGHVVEQEANVETPGAGHGVRTVCEVTFRSGARSQYTLTGDHPIVVEGT